MLLLERDQSVMLHLKVLRILEVVPMSICMDTLSLGRLCTGPWNMHKSEHALLD